MQQLSHQRRASHRGGRPGDAAWRAAWRRLAGIVATGYTSWHEPTRKAHHVDRIFCGIPGWFINWRRAARVKK